LNEMVPVIFRNDGGRGFHRNIDIFLPDCAASLFPNAHTDISLPIDPFCFTFCQIRVAAMKLAGGEDRAIIVEPG
jgi:hypothetical protein